MDLDGFIWLDECVRALLAHAVLSTERHSVSDGEGFTEERSTHANKTFKGRAIDSKRIKHAWSCSAPRYKCVCGKKQKNKRVLAGTLVSRDIDRLTVIQPTPSDLRIHF